MSSYDPNSDLDLRPRSWLEKFVARHTKSHEEVRAEMIAEAQHQADCAKVKRATFGLRRFGLGHGWFTATTVPGPRDAYIEGELAVKRAKELKEQQEQ